MSELTDLIGGGKKSSINIPTPKPVTPTIPVQPVQPVTPEKVVPDKPAIPIAPAAPAYELVLLKCGKCGVNLSVGKTSPNVNDKLKLKCSVCGTDYDKTNYLVDSTSVLFHRPFTKEQQAQFDKEVDKFMKTTKVKVETLKTENN